MQCVEVWGGSQLTSSGVELAGLDVWVYSKPYGQAQRGGDVYYVSSCASGRISRLLLADASGHGKSVASTAADLRTLMRRFVNRLDQKEFVRLLNEQFTAHSRQGSFRTSNGSNHTPQPERLGLVPSRSFLLSVRLSATRHVSWRGREARSQRQQFFDTKL